MRLPGHLRYRPAQGRVTLARPWLDAGLLLATYGHRVIAGPHVAPTVLGLSATRSDAGLLSADYNGASSLRWSRSFLGSSPAEASLFAFCATDTIAAGEYTAIGESNSAGGNTLFRLEFVRSSHLGWRAQFRGNGGTSALAGVSNSTPSTVGLAASAGAVFRSGAGAKELWYDGALNHSVTTDIGAVTLNQAEIGVLARNAPTQYWDGPIWIAAMFSKALTEAHWKALYANPWQLLTAAPRRLHFDVGAGAPSGALSASGSAAASGSADLSAGIALAGVGVALAGGSAAAAVAIPLSAAGISTAAGSATGAIAVTLSASALATAAGQAGLDVAAALAAAGSAQASGTATLSGGAEGAISASGAAQAGGAAVLSILVALAASGSAQAGGSATLSGGPEGAMSASGAAQAGGSATATVAIALTAAGLAQALGSGQLTLDIPLSAIGFASAGGVATPHVTPPAGADALGWYAANARRAHDYTAAIARAATWSASHGHA